jgi:hypothetical protein
MGGALAPVCPPVPASPLPKLPVPKLPVPAVEVQVLPPTARLYAKERFSLYPS